MRQIVLDTETTGLDPKQGHRIIEIGCVELIERRLTGNNYHQYLNPERIVDQGAIEVHGITNEFLADKPVFADVAQEFIDYIRGAELIIHNASFDVGFMDHELRLLSAEWSPVEQLCEVTDTLKMARQRHPGQRNNLDALCKRYEINNTHRELHGALLDAEILADLYLAMTGGQTALVWEEESAHADASAGARAGGIRRVAADRPALRVVRANETELAAHETRLADIAQACGGEALWLSQAEAADEE